MGVDPNGIQSAQFIHENMNIVIEGNETMNIVYKDVLLRPD